MVGIQNLKPGIIGRFGLDEHNNAGNRLTELYKDNSLFIANTCFKEHMDTTRWTVSQLN